MEIIGGYAIAVTLIFEKLTENVSIFQKPDSGQRKKPLKPEQRHLPNVTTPEFTLNRLKYTPQLNKGSLSDSSLPLDWQIARNLSRLISSSTTADDKMESETIGLGAIFRRRDCGFIITIKKGASYEQTLKTMF